MLIGIAGTLGSGKGTVVEYLRSQGFAHYSSSDVLRRILNERGLPAVRENLSNLANELMQEYKGGVLHFSNKYAVEAGDENYILEALHRVNEGQYIKEMGGIILAIDADIEVRYQRISLRKEGEKDNVSFEKFSSDSQREDEGKTGSGPNIRAVAKMADYTIMNNGTVEQLQEQVKTFLDTYRG